LEGNIILIYYTYIYIYTHTHAHTTHAYTILKVMYYEIKIKYYRY